MALTPTLLTSGSSTTDGTLFTTASVSPTAGSLQLLWVIESITKTSPSSVVGCDLTWVAVGTADIGAFRRLTLYRAMGTPSAGTIAITFAGSQNSCAWVVAEVAGVDTSGTDGSGAIVQAVAGTEGTMPITGPTLDAFENADNLHMAAVFVASASFTITEDALFTPLGETGTTGNPIRLSVAYAANVLENTSTFGDSSAAIVYSIEVKADPGDGIPEDETVAVTPWPGTTSTALQTGEGQYGFALLIEGYPYVICDAADTAAVVTAYTGTGWSQALPGLKVIGSIKQSIEPFKEDLDIPTLTFHVMDCDGDDTFGRAIWKSKPTIQSRLNAVFEPAADGSGVVTVRSNAAYDSSGTVYLGTRAIAYSAKSGGTGLTVSAAGAGVYAPFTASGSNVYNRPQRLAGGVAFDVAAPPRVSDVPATWHGKHVALYIHRISGGVWATRANAHLEFAGTIAKLQDGEGVTVVTCHDMRKKIEDATLLRTQFVGSVKQGIYLRTGDKLKVTETTSGAVPLESGEFTVVASGASGDDEANAGLYEYGAFLEMIERWLAADGTLAATWSARVHNHLDAGYRTVISAKWGSTALHGLLFYANTRHIMEFMGFTDYTTDDDGGSWLRAAADLKYMDQRYLISRSAPYRTRALYRAGHVGAELSVELESSTGTWLNHEEFLPRAVHGSDTGQNWAYVIIGESQLAVAEYSSATLLINVRPIAGFGQPYATLDEFNAPGITYDDSAEALEVRQLVLLTGKFSEIMPRLFASIDGRGINHATYDDFPWGAAVPWSLLGDAFVNSCASLETAEGTDTISIRLDRPTKLKDVLIPEMALRFAFLVFKEGGYRFVSPPVPNSTTADHTLDETNKAVGPGETVPMTSCEWTSDYLCNIVKIQYKRSFDGKFLGNPLTIKDQVSIDLHGESEPLTIDAVNSIDDRANISGSTVEHLAGNIASRIFPSFGRPVKVLRRSVAPTLYHATPGDTAALSDDLVRDPTSGGRGMSGRACIVLSSQHDYGHEGGRLFGEVSLLHSDEDRTFPLSPAAEIDTSFTSGDYTNGYDSTNFRLKLKDHAFSKSTDALDVTHFDHGDLIRIVQLDPADPSSIDAWDRTLHASTGVGADYLQMTASLSSPAWSGSTKKFVVIPQAYSDVTASQQLHAFQADDADGLIEDEAEPNGLGTQTQLSFTRSVATDLPALLADESYGDGKPLTPYQLQYLTRMRNNLISYKTAPHLGTINVSNFDSAGNIHLIFPFYIGGIASAGTVRYLSIAPMIAFADITPSTLTVVSSRFPPTGTLNNPVWSGPTRSITFDAESSSFVIADAQDLVPIPAQLPGHTWISVVIGNECVFKGFPAFRLKPIA